MYLPAHPCRSFGCRAVPSAVSRLATLVFLVPSLPSEYLKPQPRPDLLLFFFLSFKDSSTSGIKHLQPPTDRPTNALASNWHCAGRPFPPISSATPAPPKVFTWTSDLSIDTSFSRCRRCRRRRPTAQLRHQAVARAQLLACAQAAAAEAARLSSHKSSNDRIMISMQRSLSSPVRVVSARTSHTRLPRRSASAPCLCAPAC